jgi:hypothetical protein
MRFAKSLDRALILSTPFQRGCQSVYFKAKNQNLDIFWRAVEWKMLVYFTAVWNM